MPSHLLFYIYLCNFFIDDYFSHQTISNIHYSLTHSYVELLLHISDIFLGSGRRIIDKTKSLLSWSWQSSGGNRRQIKKKVRGEGEKYKEGQCALHLRGGDSWTKLWSFINMVLFIDMVIYKKAEDTGTAKIFGAGSSWWVEEWQEVSVPEV